MRLQVKNPSYHNALPALQAANTSIEALLLAALQQQGYGGRLGSTPWLAAPVFIQCFEVGTLRALSKVRSTPRLGQGLG